MRSSVPLFVSSSFSRRQETKYHPRRLFLCQTFQTDPQCLRISRMSNLGMTRHRHAQWSAAGVVFAVVVVANVFTYWILCRPELEMRAKDPHGYSYLRTVLGQAGGILA